MMMIIIIIILNLFFQNSFSVLKEATMGGRTCMAGQKNSLNWWRRSWFESNVNN
jgi:hypothetical protein